MGTLFVSRGTKGKIVGQKAPIKLKDIWGAARRAADGRASPRVALFNLGIDSKLRGCELVALRVRDACHGEQVAARAIMTQPKTQRPVQFGITPAREAVQAWIKCAGLTADNFLFPSRIHGSPHLGMRQYARILGGWVEDLGLDPADYGTQSMRRTKATLISTYKKPTSVQLLLGHSKLGSTIRYLGTDLRLGTPLQDGMSRRANPVSTLALPLCSRRNGHRLAAAPRLHRSVSVQRR